MIYHASPVINAGHRLLKNRGKNSVNERSHTHSHSKRHSVVYTVTVKPVFGFINSERIIIGLYCFHRCIK